MYLVYADTKFHSKHMGLVSACVEARTSAVARPGVDFVVERDAVEVANYCVKGGKLAAWMA